jgi:hypothetical protein
MTELEGLIHFWKATLKGTRWLLPPSTKAHIENTIKKLEELNKLRGGTK